MLKRNVEPHGNPCVIKGINQGVLWAQEINNFPSSRKEQNPITTFNSEWANDELMHGTQEVQMGGPLNRQRDESTMEEILRTSIEEAWPRYPSKTLDQEIVELILHSGSC